MQTDCTVTSETGAKAFKIPPSIRQRICATFDTANTKGKDWQLLAQKLHIQRYTRTQSFRVLKFFSLRNRHISLLRLHFFHLTLTHATLFLNTTRNSLNNHAAMAYALYIMHVLQYLITYACLGMSFPAKKHHLMIRAPSLFSFIKERYYFMNAEGFSDNLLLGAYDHLLFAVQRHQRVETPPSSGHKYDWTDFNMWTGLCTAVYFKGGGILSSMRVCVSCVRVNDSNGFFLLLSVIRARHPNSTER